MEEKEFDKKKAHQSRHSGRKAEKKSAKNKHVQEQTAKERNPKAFAFQSAVKAQRRFVRSQDIKSKKHHIPVIDRTPLEPPPVVVAVVGGPKVGKSTLLQCLIKNYTRQRLSSIMGPVTIVAGKKRRLTFIEVNNDVNSMIDIAKVADIVLMLIDATFGIEMETFEFLEICRAHGTPRIMGVLNHLDMFKDNKALKKKKRTLKQRFQVELYPGAKLFYLSGLIHGEYLKNEIKNLGRFISVMKFRPLTWRSAHPYVLVDRIEDITNPEAIRTNPKCDRDAVLYGYVRGVPFQRNQRVHIPGCGDFQIKDINFLSDPCPLPEHQKKRSLNEKERLTYAPMSGVGGIVYDKDAVYIDLGGSHHGKKMKEEGSDSEDERKGDSILEPLLDLQKTADEKRAQTQIQLFSNTKLLNNESDEETDMETVSKSLPEHETVTDSTGRVRRRAIFHDDLEKEEDDDDNDEEDDDNDEEEDDEDDEYEDEDSQEEEIEENDENEESEEEESVKDQDLNELEPPVKKKKLIISKKKKKNSSDDSDSEDYDLEDDLSRLKGENIEKSDSEAQKSKFKVFDNTEKETIGLKNKDVEVTMKIQGLLNKLKAKPPSNTNVKSRTISGDSGISESEESEGDESESEDDNDMQITTNDNSFDTRDMESKDGETSEGSSSEDENEDSNLGYRSEMFKQATDNFYKNQSTVSYLRKYIYGEVTEEEENGSDDDSEEVGGLFRSRNKTKQASSNSGHGLMEAVDTSRYNPTYLRNWADDELLDSIRDCFVTGEWKESENAAALLKMDDEDEDLYGDFEDLETGVKVSAEQTEKGEEDKNEDELNEGDAPTAADVKPVEKTAKEKRMEKKRRLKEMFDAEYDDKGDNEYFDSLKTEMSQQAQMNREEFEQLDDEQRVQYEGYRPGMYVRMEFSRMPCEFITNFDATYPIVVGGLLDNEQKMGFIRVRIKVHRWYPKILKNKDPLILSLGWRRFQTLMYYAKREDDFKMRSLKYARKYLHIEGMFWGPVTPISSGFVALQNITDRVADFRIAANGVILETDQSSKICKKLKLIGHPEKILKKTAFIKGMFSSETEIAKFEGAKVQTQSGIRGLIKKAKGRDGIFRATFEDIIKLSDVIIFKTWAPVTLTKYCSSVRTLLLPPNEKAAWKGMRTVGEIKRERNIKNTPNPDSLYTAITKRREYVPLPLKVPKELQAALPYNEKPKITPRINKPQRVVVVKDPHEIKMDNFMKRLKTMMDDRIERDEAHKQSQKTKYQADIAGREHMRQMREKRKKASACRYKSKKEGKKNKNL